MSEEFTNQARAIWDAVPQQAKFIILNNVWCGQCRGSTTIVNLKGNVEEGDLILRGQCAKCGNGVTRLVENE